MSIEQQALDLVKENEELKAQVNNLLKACKIYGDFNFHSDFNLLDEADTIQLMTPKQCLSSVKADAVDYAFKMIDGCDDMATAQLMIIDYTDRLRNK